MKILLVYLVIILVTAGSVGSVPSDRGVVNIEGIVVGVVLFSSDLDADVRGVVIKEEPTYDC